MPSAYDHKFMDLDPPLIKHFLKFYAEVFLYAERQFSDLRFQNVDKLQV